jgi:hypothetical protein
MKTERMKINPTVVIRNAVTHATAVSRLREAGWLEVAEQVKAWRNKEGNLGGWDQWVRVTFEPEVITKIWRKR